MRWTILGSGGCAVTPKPLCQCRICREARRKGPPYARAGPSAFLHDINLLIDTPAEIAGLLNRSRISRVDHLVFSHLDPDHVEGFRVVEQIALDFSSWRAHPEKRVCLLCDYNGRRIDELHAFLVFAVGAKDRVVVPQDSIEVVAELHERAVQLMADPVYNLRDIARGGGETED